jgi:hypothetical protein
MPIHIIKNRNSKILWAIGALVVVGMGVGYYLVMGDLDQIKNGFDTYKAVEIDEAVPELQSKTVKPSGRLTH